MQHALSNSKDIDPERGITDKGREETIKIGKYLKKLKPEIQIIWRSGKTRSYETAEILAELLGIKEMVKEKSNLNPNDSIDPIKLELIDNNKNIIIVGHLPYLSRLLADLICEDENKTILKFRNSGVVCLEQYESKWNIIWAVTTEIL